MRVKNYTKEQEKQVIELLEKNITYNEIIKITKLSLGSIKYIKSKNKIVKVKYEKEKKKILIIFNKKYLKKLKN